MKYMIFLLIAFYVFTTTAISQTIQYTVANAHSHNDYEQSIPFYAAYRAGFGSIEADIFLQNGELLVAHDQRKLTPRKTLDSLYLKPLLHCVEQNNGFAYADTARKLQMMIDIKTDAQSTLQKLVEVLQQYPELVDNKSVRWVISGNRPAAGEFTTYPDFILFDGRLDSNYSQPALSKIAMLSDDLSRYTHWNGNNNLPVDEQQQLKKFIAKAHQLGKPVRFWGAPDVVNAWLQLIKLQVDYINTDQIGELAAFFINLKSFGNSTSGTP